MLCGRFGQRLAVVARPRLDVNLILSSGQLVFDSVRQDEKIRYEVHTLLESVLLRRDIRRYTLHKEQVAGRFLRSSFVLLRVVEVIRAFFIWADESDIEAGRRRDELRKYTHVVALLQVLLVLLRLELRCERRRIIVKHLLILDGHVVHDSSLRVILSFHGYRLGK